jgi:protein-S-isoprenylcysteine O-methyltransferase Ste14
MPATTSDDHAQVIAYPPFIVTSCLLAGAAIYLFRPVHLASWPIAVALSVVFAIASKWLQSWAQRQLERAGTTVLPSGATTTIVRSGPYAFTRNPLYVAQALLFVAISLAFNSLAMMAMIVPWWIVTHFGVVLREEGYLERKFGAEYGDYRRSVRRWF